MRRIWKVGTAAAVAVVIGATVVYVVRESGWLGPRPRYQSVPTCEVLFTSAAVDNAVRTAFSRTWEFRRTSYEDLRDAPLCSITALPDAVVLPPPKTGTPWSRSVTVGLRLFREDWQSARSPLFLRGGVREAREQFQQDRRNACRPSDGAGIAGFGDEALLCRAGDDQHLLFRSSNLNVAVELSGSNYGTAHVDLEQDMRCIAQAVALRFGITVGDERSCGDSALAA